MENSSYLMQIECPHCRRRVALAMMFPFHGGKICVSCYNRLIKDKRKEVTVNW